MSRPGSRRTLRQHARVIQRSLADLRSGKKTDHLSSDELAQMILGLEKRLSEVTEKLTSTEGR